MDEPGLRALLGRVRTEAELDRIYRQLSKHTHPDLTGKDGSDFRVLSECYREAKARISAGTGGMPGGAEPLAARGEPPARGEQPASAQPLWSRPDFDPWCVIKDLGLGTRFGPRAALYLSLYRFQAAGLSNHRLRGNDKLRRRNELIEASIHYWALVYAPDFERIFTDYTGTVLDGLKPTAFLKAGADSRRQLDEGLGHCFRYQTEGRPVARTLALRALENAIDTIEVYHLENHATAEFALWLIGELELPPLALPL